MSEIAEVRHALQTSDAGELCLQGLCETDDPLVLPARPFRLRGEGCGSTILRVSGGDAIVCERSPRGGPTVLEHLTIQTTGTGGDAIRIVNRGTLDHSQRLVIRDVSIEPAGPSAFRRGIALDDVWNVLIENVDIVGHYGDLTPAALQKAHMEVAIELQEGQEVRIRDVRITCAKYGIRGRATRQGTGEGIFLAPQFIINCLRAIDLQGGTFGGIRTPWVTVTDGHLFYCERGVTIRGYSGVRVLNVNACASHFVERYDGMTHTVWPIAVELGDCTDVQVSHLRAWKTGMGLGYGLALLNCDGGAVQDSTVDQSMVSLSLWLHSCRQVRYSDNQFQARQFDPSGVLDQFPR